MHRVVRISNAPAPDRKSDGASDLAVYAVVVARSGSTGVEAGAVAERIGAPAAVVAVAKAAIGATTAADVGPYADMVATFLASLRSQSVFMRLLNDGMIPAPLLTPIRALTVALTGNIVSEGAPTPIGRVAMNSPALKRGTARALIALSKEVLASTSPAALAFVETELRKAVTAAADAAFLAIARDGLTALAATGTDAEAALADLKAMLGIVNTAGGGNLFWICSPSVANAASTLTGLAGSLVFPAMGPKGGEILNLPVLVSDQVPASSLFLIDAGGLAGDAETVTIEHSEAATLQMRNDPDNAAAELVSLWQTNGVAIRAGLVFGLDRCRANAVALLEGIAWGGAAS